MQDFGLLYKDTMGNGGGGSPQPHKEAAGSLAT